MNISDYYFPKGVLHLIQKEKENLEKLSRLECSCDQGRCRRCRKCHSCRSFDKKIDECGKNIKKSFIEKLLFLNK